MSALVPVMLRGTLPENRKAEDLISHITFDRPMDSSLLERDEKALRRIGIGLDVPPEIITGFADSNHWSAWAIDDSTFRHHIEPLVVRVCDAFTAGYLRHVLPEYGVDPVWAARVLVWYDASALTRRPNRADDAKTGHAANVLSDRVLVEALGFDPDVDMPDETELARRLAQVKGSIDPALTEILMRLLILPSLPVVERALTAHERQSRRLARRQLPGQETSPRPRPPPPESRRPAAAARSPRQRRPCPRPPSRRRPAGAP